MRRSAIRALNPFLFLPLLAAKKVAVYKVAEAYGFPLVYRRLAEGVKRTMPVEQQARVRNAIKASMRSPKEVFSLINDSGVIEFIEKYSRLIVEKSPVSVPPFMVTLAESFVKDSLPGRIWGFLSNSSKK